jgi:stage V sporulation protein AC
MQGFFGTEYFPEIKKGDILLIEDSLKDAATIERSFSLLKLAGVFDKIGQYAGAGAFVPISGFANAMVSPAMEFTREGLVLGLGCKLFTIAGPVLVWGVSASVVYGVIYWLITILG